MRDVVLAGQLKDLGDGLLSMFTGWAPKALLAALVLIVVVKIIQKFSMKAGIGALLGLALCLGIYESRDDLADMFKDEINNPNGAGIVQPKSGGGGELA